MYRSIAKYYDRLGWNEFHDIAWPRLKPLLDRRRSRSYLDLACGTGSLVFTVAETGRETVGLDNSHGMLAMATKRLAEYKGKNPPRFIRRDMTRFNLHRQFDAVGCFFDAANHILEPANFASFIECAHRHVAPGGFFIFDVNTAIGLNHWDSILFTRQAEHAVLMRGEYDRSTRLASITIHGFVRDDQGDVDRFRETFYERGYPHKTIIRLLRRAGFRDIEAVPQRAETTLRTAGRVFYTAWRKL